jgi:hypothetical protein
MNTYNVVLKDSDGAQRQYGVSASTWANAIIAAKKQAGLEATEKTDENLMVVQWTGRLDVTGD